MNAISVVVMRPRLSPPPARNAARPSVPATSSAPSHGARPLTGTAHGVGPLTGRAAAGSAGAASADTVSDGPGEVDEPPREEECEHREQRVGQRAER